MKHGILLSYKREAAISIREESLDYNCEFILSKVPW